MAWQGFPCRSKLLFVDAFQIECRTMNTNGYVDDGFRIARLAQLWLDIRACGDKVHTMNLLFADIAFRLTEHSLCLGHNSSSSSSSTTVALSRYLHVNF